MKLKKLKLLSSILSISALVGVFSLVACLSDQEKSVEESSATYYYESVDEANNSYTIFGTVNSINQSYFYGIPSYTEDEDFQSWGTLGDYYINVSSRYEDSNRITDVSLQYKLKSCFLIRQSDAELNIEDVYYFNGDYVNFGTGRVGTNKIISSISLQQTYIFVDDDSGNRSLTLGLRLYFNFNDNTNAGVTFNNIVYEQVLSGDGYNYDDTSVYLMDYLNIQQTLSTVASNSQETLDGYYNQGYDIGYNNGYDDGVSSQQMEIQDSYDDGYADGYNAGFNSDSTVSTIFSGIIQVALVPVNFFLGVFNFEILGINLRAFIQALFTVAITIIVVKSVIGAKGGGSSD